MIGVGEVFGIKFIGDKIWIYFGVVIERYKNKMNSNVYVFNFV